MCVCVLCERTLYVADVRPIDEKRVKEKRKIVERQYIIQEFAWNDTMFPLQDIHGNPVTDVAL